jgi:hypothetical protein
MDVPFDSVRPNEGAFFMGHRAAPHGRGRVGESSGGSARADLSWAPIPSASALARSTNPARMFVGDSQHNRFDTSTRVTVQASLGSCFSDTDTDTGSLASFLRIKFMAA